MLRKVLTGLAQCACALGVAPLALGGGIPVFDAPLNSTAAVQLHQQITTATQNVAQTLKQVDQYAEQVRQYQTQLMQYAQRFSQQLANLLQLRFRQSRRSSRSLSLNQTR